jgi:hypothetical protein
LLLPPLQPKTGKPAAQPPTGCQGHPLDTQNRGCLAKPARSLWKVGKGSNRVLSVAKSRYWETSLRRPTSRCRLTPKARLSGLLGRSNCDSCTPTPRGCKKGGESQEKLGRDRGGFSSKIHIGCESKGKPITFLLSPGQRKESIFLEQLMELLSSKRILVQIDRPRLPPEKVEGDKGSGTSSHPQLSTARYQFYPPTTFK